MYNDKTVTNKRIAGKINSISGRNKTLRKDIQLALCDIAAAVFKHGDVTAYNKLFSACKGQDRTALAEWIAAYGFATLRPDGTFGKNKDAVANSEFPAQDADAVYADYTDENTVVRPWYTLVKSAKQVASAMKPTALILKLAADIGKHSDPASEFDAEKGQQRKEIQWGEAGEFERAIEQLIANAASAQVAAAAQQNEVIDDTQSVFAAVA